VLDQHHQLGRGELARFGGRMINTHPALLPAFPERLPAGTKGMMCQAGFGSLDVEAGKVADLSIVEGDPLQDIWMTQNVKMVIMDGKVIDIGFKRYKNPIPSFYSFQSLPLDLEIAPNRTSEAMSAASSMASTMMTVPFIASSLFQSSGRA
jgi:hypothetical protein